MLLSFLLTALAICGVWAGAVFGDAAHRYAEHLAAAGGGLLCGIAAFWLVPEAGETTGLPAAVALALSVAALLGIIDRALTHGGYSVRRGVVWPLLLATGIHSFLDGWSVRMLGIGPTANWAVTAGLALHKVPEGAALGWLTQKSLHSFQRALVAGASAELFTLAGAYAELRLNQSGTALFGGAWTAAVLAVIAGGFLFIAVHAVAPVRKRADVIGIFVTALAVVGGLTFWK